MKAFAAGRYIAIVFVGILCLALLGCAGGASSATTPGPTPTPNPNPTPTPNPNPTPTPTPTPTPGPSPSPTPSPTPTPTPTAHSVNLSWTASSSPNIIAYNVYRANTSSGPFINVGSATGTSYIDTTVQAGATYFYEVTSVDSANIESVPTSPVSVAVP